VKSLGTKEEEVAEPQEKRSKAEPWNEEKKRGWSSERTALTKR